MGHHFHPKTNPAKARYLEDGPPQWMEVVRITPMYKPYILAFGSGPTTPGLGDEHVPTMVANYLLNGMILQGSWLIDVNWWFGHRCFRCRKIGIPLSIPKLLQKSEVVQAIFYTPYIFSKGHLYGAKPHFPPISTRWAPASYKWSYGAPINGLIIR